MGLQFFPRLRRRWGEGAGPWADSACDEHPLPCPAEPLSSVSSLEVHFDLLDLTELTDMSDQELAEVFADSDDESLAGESPAGGLLLGRGEQCGAVLGPKPVEHGSPQPL